MTEPPEQPGRRRRQPRETVETPRGIGGASPHPARGPVTALRVLGHGFEIAVEADRVRRLGPNAGVPGSQFMYKGQQVLALDEPSRQLIEPLTSFCGLGAHNDVDCALAAILWPRPKRPIILHGTRGEDVWELARTIHEHTIQREFPFTRVDAMPASDAAVEALCTQGGCGTLFLDFTTGAGLPPRLRDHLFANQDHDHYHLGTIAVARSEEELQRCLGPEMRYYPICTLGFERVPWHAALHNVTFTEH